MNEWLVMAIIALVLALRTPGDFVVGIIAFVIGIVIFALTVSGYGEDHNPPS